MSDDPRRGLPSVDRLVRALEQARPELPGWTLREGARRVLAAALFFLARPHGHAAGPTARDSPGRPRRVVGRGSFRGTFQGY